MCIRDRCNTVVSDSKFKVLSSISNGSHKGIIKNFIRYLKYFTFPFLIFLNREKYNVILGWQQFYAINFALFCRLFHVNKCNTNVVVNFTYKHKSGIIGKIYYLYMKYCCQSEYIDYFHVPSYNYIDICSKELGINKEKFIVTSFGVPDTYEDMKYLKTPMKDYSLSIGRSNRDFNFLVNVWKQDCMKGNTLLIVSDTWKPAEQMPPNVCLLYTSYCLHRNQLYNASTLKDYLKVLFIDVISLYYYNKKSKHLRNVALSAIRAGFKHDFSGHIKYIKE